MRLKSGSLVAFAAAFFAILLYLPSSSSANVGGYVFPGDFRGSVTTASEYVFRGLSRTDEKPAVQGSFDLHLYDFYLGVWASNADFGANDDVSVELNFYGGYRADLGSGFSLDVGAIQYKYPSSDTRLDYDFYEFYTKLKKDFGYFITDFDLYYAPDYQYDAGPGVYMSFGVEMPIYKEFHFIGHYGYQTMHDEGDFPFGGDYGDWEVGFGYDDFYGIDFKATYIDTDLTEENCNELCDGRFLLSAHYDFDMF